MCVCVPILVLYNLYCCVGKYLLTRSLVNILSDKCLVSVSCITLLAGTLRINLIINRQLR